MLVANTLIVLLAVAPALAAPIKANTVDKAVHVAWKLAGRSVAGQGKTVSGLSTGSSAIRKALRKTKALNGHAITKTGKHTTGHSGIYAVVYADGRM